MSAAGWTVLLAAAAMVMLVVPLMPAWREWSHPTDHAALHVASENTSRADYFAARFREEVQRTRELPQPVLPPPSEWSRVGGAIIVERSLQLHAPARTAAALYVEGDFEAPGGSVFGAVLATGDLHLGPECQVQQWAHADGAITLERGCAALRRISAASRIALAPECSFERIQAPRVEFGMLPGSAAQQPPSLSEGMLADLPDCRVMAAGFHRVEGNAVLAPATSYAGSLVVTESLAIGERSVVHGAVKARRGIVVGEGARLFGALCCEGSIHIGRDAHVEGPVVSAADVIIGAGAVIGSPDRPTTVTAENVMIESGALAHGTVWAREVGVVWVAT